MYATKSQQDRDFPNRLSLYRPGSNRMQVTTQKTLCAHTVRGVMTVFTQGSQVPATHVASQGIVQLYALDSWTYNNSSTNHHRNNITKDPTTIERLASTSAVATPISSPAHLHGQQLSGDQQSWVQHEQYGQQDQREQQRPAGWVAVNEAEITKDDVGQEIGPLDDQKQVVRLEQYDSMWLSQVHLPS